MKINKIIIGAIFVIIIVSFVFVLENGHEKSLKVECDYPAVVVKDSGYTEYDVKNYENSEVVKYNNNRYVNYLSIEEKIYTDYYFSEKDAYVDIVSIVPKYRVQEYENKVPTFNTDIVCECYTEEGYKIYVYISPYAYNEYIDPYAEFSNMLVWNSFETKKFDKPFRIYGQARMTKDMCEDMLVKTETDLIFEFTRIISDKEVEMHGS